MRRVELPNKPDLAVDFELDGFDPPRFARVMYQPGQSRPDRIAFSTEAFEVDDLGRIVASPLGTINKTPSQNHVISTQGVGDVRSWLPGWVRVEDEVPDPDEPRLEALPDSAEAFDRAVVGEDVYRWDPEGLLERALADVARDLERRLTA